MKKIKRFFRMVIYCERIEHFCLLDSIFFNVLEVIRPFFLLYLSKIIIEAIIQKSEPEKVITSTAILLSVFMLLTVISGIFEKRGLYRLKCFLKKHNMQKALALLNLNYEFTEQNEIQESLAQMKQLEKYLVFSPNDFIRKTGTFISGITGCCIALYLGKNIFLKQSAETSYSTLMNIAFLIMLIVFSITSFFSSKYIYKKFGEHLSKNLQTRYLNAYTSLIYDYKTGKDIRLYDKELAESYSKKYQEVHKSGHDFMAKFFSVTVGLEKLLEGLFLAMVVLFVGIKALYGLIPISEVFFYIGIINMFSAQMYQAADAVTTIISADKYRELLFKFYDLKNIKESGSLIPNKENGFFFEFKNVSFKYPNSEKYVLKNINLKLNFKKKLALVGQNGSGKSTLIKLLVRLYDPSEGEILLNGINIKEYSYNEYIKIFSVVFQDFKLLSFTTGQNISVSDVYNKEIAKDALIKTGMEKFYHKHGLQTYLYQNFETDGIEISGGEAQKIAMARAIYHKGEIFILDEPTAALDPISEAEIYKHFDGITLNNTAVYISHRLSSCKFCDNIAVMENGSIIQYGSHNELVSETNGKYYELWNAQAKYYKK